MPKSTIEQQGLLQPESFDLDDLEASEPPSQNGHARHPSEEWSRPRKAWTSSAPGWMKPRYIIIGLCVLAALLVLGVALNKGGGFKIRRPGGYTHLPKPPAPGEAITNGTVKTWEKPEDFKIIGLIFFGRPSLVAILDCYLKKNLVTRGGWLDEVHFVVNTKNEEDIAYLDRLVETEDLYKKIVIPNLGYNEVWKEGVESEHMYIKIDDDIVGGLSCHLGILSWLMIGMTGLFQRRSNLRHRLHETRPPTLPRRSRQPHQ